MFAPIDSEGGDMGGYATTKYVDDAIEAVDAKIPTKVSELDNDAKYLTAHQDISGKQDVIENLDEIIAGAAKGATSIQSLDGYATEEFVTGQGYATVSEVEGKQDKIEDLDAIRTKVDNAITTETLNESLNNYYTKSDIDDLIGDVKSYIKDTILA